MNKKTMPYNHGQVCEHDKLKRQCDDCRNEWEIARLHEIIAVLRAEVKAWREAQDIHDLTHFLGDQHNDAVLRAMDATDASGVLEDK